MEFGAKCEYAKLKKVLMFQPGEEVKQITIKSFNEFSFRDVVYWRKFQQEHENFCELLINENIEVLYLNDLLTQEDKNLIDPNLVYLRDTCAITEEGFIQMRMAKQVRTSEPLLVSKSLKKLFIPEFLEIVSPGLLEGGDFVFPDDRTLFIGYSPRSNEEGGFQAANALLDSVVATIVLVPLPSWRVHLDGALMFLDKDLILYHPAAIETFPSRVLRKDQPVELISLMEFIYENYQPEKIPISDNELYLFGANVVSLSKRKCVIYEWNERIIKELNDRDVEVLSISGSELARGGGGPHCMTLPLLRKE